MMSPEELNGGSSKFRLLKVSWHRATDADSASNAEPGNRVKAIDMPEPNVQK